MLGYFGAQLRMGTVYASDGRWFVVEWRNMMDIMEYANLTMGRATFQLAVSEANPTTVHVKYLSLSGSYDGTSAIIGAHGYGGNPNLLLSNGDSGSVAGSAVPLKADVLPHDFPDAEIKWRVVSGGGTFSGGGTGRTVQFTASGGEELKNKVAADWFAAFDTTRIIGKVDFCKVWMNGLRKERT